jgi:uncharacterized protein (TIGR02246 family)
MLAHTSLLTLLLLATPTIAQAAVAAGDFKEEMQKLADDWREAFNAKDADKLASTFTKDGELIVPRGNVLGTSAIRDQYRKATSEEGDTLLALTVTRAVHSGNLAYITGTYTGTSPKPGGGMQTGSGHFVSVMKRVRGKWLIAATASVPGIQK